MRNEDPKDAKLREYQAEIERLRALILRRKAAAGERQPRPRRERPRARDAPGDGAGSDDGDARSLHSEHLIAESHIEAERRQTEELEGQIRKLEERLVQGGAGGGKELINNLNRSQLELERRHHEIAERKKREVEMQQKIEVEEETTAIVTNTFATLQQEVDHKTQRCGEGRAAGGGGAGARRARALECGWPAG